MDTNNGKHNDMIYFDTSLLSGCMNIKTVLPNEKDIEVIINDDVTVVRNRKTKAKVVLRKCDADEEDREKAILYGLLKLVGFKKASLDRIIDNARDCRKAESDEENN